MFFYNYRTITFIWLFFVILAISPVTKSQSRDLIDNLENIIEIREQTRRFNIDRDYYFDFQARPSPFYPTFHLEFIQIFILFIRCKQPILKSNSSNFRPLPISIQVLFTSDNLFLVDEKMISYSRKSFSRLPITNCET